MSQLGNLGSIPLVSVVMPTLQQAAFIEASIDSVLSQSYANIELIVADGGSADGTQEILRNRAAQDHRLRWFSEKDNGPAQALNRALKKVRGTIIGWLNSDDLYTPHAIDHAVAALVRHPKWMMLYGEAEHVDVAGKVINR
jgi:glycosyltransferase involved in cell wall biosynthesis